MGVVFWPLERITSMVAALREPTPSGHNGGTATLIGFKDRPFLLTAKHVADCITINGMIVIKGAGDRPIVIPIRQLVSTAGPTWKPHHEADIAAFEISPQDQATHTVLQQRFLQLEFFLEKKAAPQRELFLTSIGFPLGLGTDGYFSPLTFESKASSGLLTLPRADTHTPQAFFALENPSVGGYSGCPVVDLSVFKSGPVTTYGSGPCFYGVMHGTISDHTGGKIAPVTPSLYVHELFASF